jgi:signal transduction histidine kinase
MPISRLRLRIAVRFAVAVLVVVAVVDVGLSAYLWRDADRRLTRDLESTAVELQDAIRREAAEPGATDSQAVHDALEEWPAGPTAFAVFGTRGAPLGVRGAARVVALLRLPATPVPGAVATVPLNDEGDLRVIVNGDAMRPRFWVVAARSTAELREYGELLLGWLVVTVPGVALVSLLAGYWLARRALRPMRDMAAAIGGLAPNDLDRRLPVRAPPDEIDRLADRFNGLLERLVHARDRNRSFLARAAHQIKTPLTVIRGESALGLERPRDNEAYRTILERIRRAADQMVHRVDDLFLLAQAEAGDQPPIQDAVELDGLALECADLMRGRAQQTRHSLELDRVDAGVARGNEPLLREALLELLENAVRYGGTARPIRVSAYAERDRANLVVATAGPPLPEDVLDAPPSRDGAGGLGLSIVGWIARVHGGVLSCSSTDGTNVFRVTWPVAGPVAER